MVMTIRERVKKLCDDNGVSLNKVETECGVAKGYLSKLDKSNPSANTLHSIAKYLGVTTDYLLTGEEEISLPDQMDLWNIVKKDKDMLNALEKYIFLSDEKKKHIIDMINLLSEDK